MNFENYNRCFSEEELCAGAELVLSGEIKTHIEEMTEQDFSPLLSTGGGAMTTLFSSCGSEKEGEKPADSTETASVSEDTPEFTHGFPCDSGLPSESTSGASPEKPRFCKVSISSCSDDFLISPQKGTYHSALCFDRKRELVLSTSCNCPDFQKDHYGCAHLAAALTSFYMEEEGPDFFHGTRLEESLKEISGADDPFAPGVMKRTDPRLRSFLQASPSENALPVWEEKSEESPQKAPQLHCEYTIFEVGDAKYMELKTGAQRSYIIKDIPSFLETYRNNDMYTFGKNQYVLCEENFGADSLPLLNLLLKIQDLLEGISSPFISLGSSHDRRYLKADDYVMSNLLDISDGSDLCFSDGRKIPVHLDRIGLEATLRKKTYGASISIRPVHVFSKKTGGLYLQDNEGIFCVSAYEEDANMLDALLSSPGPAYIRESDLPVFLSRFLPFFEREGRVILKGFHPDNYEKEVPDFAIYLDLEDSETISCKPYSVYSDPAARYCLFDNQTGTLHRNGPAETEFSRKLTSLFDTYDRGTGTLYVNRNEEELFEFLQRELPDLQTCSTVYISDRMKRIRVRKLPSLSVEIIRQASSLLMSIRADAITREEMQKVLCQYTLKKKYFRLKDGSFFDFEDTDSQVWETLSDLYQHYGKKDPRLFSIPLYRTLYLDEMLSDRKNLVLNGDTHYKNILLAAKEETGDEIALPPSLENVLRPYQTEGFRWISRLRKMGFGGILADDMGLGKTIQVLTFLLAEKQSSNRTDLVSDRTDLEPDRTDQKPDWTDPEPDRTDQKPDWTDQKPDWTDLEPAYDLSGKTPESTSLSDQQNPPQTIAENVDSLSSETRRVPAPSLIICPASLVYNWEKELERFTPQLTCVMIVGTQTERHRKIQENHNTDVWITSYDLLKRDIAFYEDIVFSHEIIDEAQYIKNQSTQAAKSVRAIHADFRLALTGTPIENRLSELWSIMDYLMPGFLYPYTRFQKEFEIPITLDSDSGSLERLRRMVHPFILRRMKSDVLKELPEKLEEVVSVSLEGSQRRIYDAYASKLKRSLEKSSDREFTSGKIQILAEITRLRQICCDPSLVVEFYNGENAKLETCIELVKEAIESGHKLLLFSQFTTMLDIICARLTAEKLSYYRIDGSTAKERRMEMVDSFAGDEIPIFCISLKAGGTGLNLTAADIVIHYDPWWNQAAQNQATDRAHRIGQKNKVSVYELVAKNTLEEKIQDIKNEKAKLMQDVLSGDSISSSDFNRNDLLQML